MKHLRLISLHSYFCLVYVRQCWLDVFSVVTSHSHRDSVRVAAYLLKSGVISTILFVIGIHLTNQATLHLAIFFFFFFSFSFKKCKTQISPFTWYETSFSLLRILVCLNDFAFVHCRWVKWNIGARNGRGTQWKFVWYPVLLSARYPL